MMSMAFLVLGWAPAVASTFVNLDAVDQPLQDPDVFLLAFSDLCGGVVSIDRDSESTILWGKYCIAEVMPGRGAFRVWWPSVDHSTRSTALTDDARRLTGEDDLQLLVDLGFSAAEMTNIVTTELASDSKEIRSGGRFVRRRYHGTKTFVDREVAGAWVSGSRAVVSRNSTGALLEVQAAWPTLDATTVVERIEGIKSSVDIPVDATVLWTRPVLLIDSLAFGRVEYARIITEVAYRNVDRGDGSPNKPTAVYLEE